MEEEQFKEKIKYIHELIEKLCTYASEDEIDIAIEKIIKVVKPS